MSEAYLRCMTRGHGRYLYITDRTGITKYGCHLKRLSHTPLIVSDLEQFERSTSMVPQGCGSRLDVYMRVSISAVALCEPWRVGNRTAGNLLLFRCCTSIVALHCDTAASRQVSEDGSNEARRGVSSNHAMLCGTIRWVHRGKEVPLLDLSKRSLFRSRLAAGSGEKKMSN